MFNKPMRPKVIGFFLFIPAVLIIAVTLYALIVFSSFGFASGVSFPAMLPFLFLMTFLLCFSGASIYIAVRYFKNNPYEKNKSVGSFLVIFSVGYFVYNALTCLGSNSTGNLGGYGGTIISLLIMLILAPIGLGLKNGYK